MPPKITTLSSTADRDGPDLNPAGSGTTWLDDHDASRGNQARARQIMTNCETLAMVQAGLVVDRKNRAMPYKSGLYGQF